MGRAARHTDGAVIMYADKITKSMETAIRESNRRRKIQEEYNKKHKIIPKSIVKEIKDILTEREVKKEEEEFKAVNISKINDQEICDLISNLENQMELAARNLEFEKAAVFRDEISGLKEELERRKISRS